MSEQKLHVFIAAHQQVKKNAHSAQTDLHRTASKADMYKGFSKKYVPLREEDSFAPAPESKQVSLKGEEVIQNYREIMSEEWDLELTVRKGNTSAKADVVVDGETLLADAPTSFLLYMEKQLDELRTFVSKMPILDNSVPWSPVESETGLLRSPVRKTAVTKKMEEPLVLYPATPEHPAQTKVIVKDIIIGQWEQIGFNGSIAAKRRNELLSRIDKLSAAVKAARIEANSTVVPRENAASRLFDFLLS